MADTFADLEIGLRLWQDDPTPAKKRYSVDMRFTSPGLVGEKRPQGDTTQLAAFNTGAWPNPHVDRVAYGTELYNALFADATLRDAFREYRKQADTEGCPLRLRISFGRGADVLHDLRWEALFDPDTGTELAASDRVWFSRYLNSPTWRPVPEPSGTLRVLLVVADPDGLDAYELAKVEVEDEVERVVGALGGKEAAEFTKLATRGQATFPGLINGLRAGCDILYVVCHGKVGKDGLPRLYLEDDQSGKEGQVAVVRGDDFARGE